MRDAGDPPPDGAVARAARRRGARPQRGYPSTASGGPPPPAGEDFRAGALRLFAASALLLGWRPGEFWAATPAELGAVLGLVAPGGDGMGAGELAALMERFPDG